MSLQIKAQQQKDGRWLAKSVDLPGCVRYGKTRAEPVAEMEKFADHIFSGQSISPLNLEEDSPELEAELLKAASGPFTPWREGELREMCERILREHRAKKKQ